MNIPRCLSPSIGIAASIALFAASSTAQVTDPAGDYTKSAMTTIRVPLSAFTGADLTHIVSLYLYFDDPSHAIGSVFIDSLQFVN
ncbi:MAG: hypothetical protein ACI8UD_001943 [Planctomycetota bacterium]|jgi:hypothetical protein